MFIRTSVRTMTFGALAIFFFVFSLVGCSGEDKARSKEVIVRLDGNTGECLPQVGQKISDYFSDRLSDEELDGVWNCLQGALNDFEEITGPEHPKGYPPDALARFFAKFFLKRDIPNSVAQAIMNLKRVLVGGDREFLTDLELSKLREFLDRCRDWSIALKPHLRFLLAQDMSTLTDEQFQNSFRAAGNTLEELGHWLASQDQIYTQSDLRELLISVKTWLESQNISQDRSRLLERAIETLPVFFRIKADFVGGDDQALKPSEWVCFMRKSMAVVSTLQRLRWKLTSDRIFTLATDRSLQSQLLDIRRFFQDVDIPFSELDGVLKMASSLSWWPKSTSAEAISKSVYFVFSRILKVKESAEKMRIDQNVVNELDRVISIFNSNWDTENSELIRRLGPVDVNENGLLIYSGQERMGPEAKFQVGTIFSLMQILQQAYGIDNFEIQNLQDIFTEFLSELRRFDILTDVDPSIAGRIYREMNLFTYASDGDSVVSVTEITQYAWMVLSGMNQSQMLTKAYSELCQKDADCIYDHYAQSYSQWLVNYPKLLQFLQEESEETRQSFFEMSKAVAGSSNPILNMVVLGYIEFFVMRYDTTQNELIDFQESELAYQTFGPTFSELASSVGLKEEDSWALFTYLFKYGVNPVSEYGGLLRFVNWKLKSKDWAYEVHRVRLLQILAELKKL